MNKKEGISFILAVVLIVIFVKFAMFIAENKPKRELDLAVKLNLDGDFPNPKEGTAIFNMNLIMENIIAVHNKVPKYVIFKESSIIPGLTIRYNLHDSVFEGGIPLIKSEEVTFLDGKKHEIIYTFKEGDAQRFYFDKKEIASGKFDSSKIAITGFAVLEESDIKTLSVDGIAEFK